jgi:P pilus assembly chaperone PapD
MKILIVVIFFLSLVSSLAEASLLISPTRIAFGERDRAQRVTLINSSSEVKTYRLEWVEQRVNSQGGYEKLSPEQAATFPVASKYIRFTPRQVTLQPGQRQTIKLLARRGKEIQNNEYRSHLRFTALPSRTNNTSPMSGVAMKLNLLMSYTIPVVLRNGPLDVSAKIERIELQTNTSIPGEAHILVNLSREGKMSTTGKLVAFYKPLGTDSETQVAILNGFNFFPDTSLITKRVVWPDFVRPGPGSLRIALIGEKEFSGRVFAEKIVSL